MLLLLTRALWPRLRTLCGTLCVDRGLEQWRVHDANAATREWWYVCVVCDLFYYFYLSCVYVVHTLFIIMLCPVEIVVLLSDVRVTRGVLVTPIIE